MPAPRQPRSAAQLAALCLAGSLTLAGCGPANGRDEQPTATAETAAPETAAPAEEEARPARIYYDLTLYDWYAHGEPLVLAADTYSAGSGLRAAAVSDMQRVGDYEGVDVYVLAGDDSTVYVPVYPGYWQPFELVSAGAAAR